PPPGQPARHRTGIAAPRPARLLLAARLHPGSADRPLDHACVRVRRRDRDVDRLRPGPPAGPARLSFRVGRDGDDRAARHTPAVRTGGGGVAEATSLGGRYRGHRRTGVWRSVRVLRAPRSSRAAAGTGRGAGGGRHRGRPAGGRSARFSRRSRFPRLTVTGWTIERYEVVQSTQDVARERLTDGRVIVAAWQRAGRGRHGRPWSAPPGRALLFSAVLAPAGPVAAILPLLAGVAVRDAIASTAGVAAELKWPNDVLSDGAKVAGILVERPPGPFAVLGVGINANLEAVDLPGDWATSLLIRTGHPVDLAALLAATLEQLDQWLERAASAGIDVIVNAWRER